MPLWTWPLTDWRSPGSQGTRADRKPQLRERGTSESERVRIGRSLTLVPREGSALSKVIGIAVAMEGTGGVGTLA